MSQCPLCLLWLTEDLPFKLNFFHRAQSDYALSIGILNNSRIINRKPPKSGWLMSLIWLCKCRSLFWSQCQVHVRSPAENECIAGFYPNYCRLYKNSQIVPSHLARITTGYSHSFFSSHVIQCCIINNHQLCLSTILTNTHERCKRRKGEVEAEDTPKTI